MTMPLIKSRSNKKALSRSEYLTIIEALKKETTVLTEGTDYAYESAKKIHFYRFTTPLFPNFPSFIGKVHEFYGDKVDIRVLRKSEDILEFFIRGYTNDLK